MNVISEYQFDDELLRVNGDSVPFRFQSVLRTQSVFTASNADAGVLHVSVWILRQVVKIPCALPSTQNGLIEY